jgi:hypothetical protein
VCPLLGNLLCVGSPMFRRKAEAGDRQAARQARGGRRLAGGMRRWKGTQRQNVTCCLPLPSATRRALPFPSRVAQGADPLQASLFDQRSPSGAAILRLVRLQGHLTALILRQRVTGAGRHDHCSSLENQVLISSRRRVVLLRLVRRATSNPALLRRLGLLPHEQSTTHSSSLQALHLSAFTCD